MDEERCWAGAASVDASLQNDLSYLVDMNTAE
jgi:hypothetical protein